MSKKLNRFLSLMLAIMMILSMLPATALAAEEDVISVRTEEELLVALESGGQIVTAADIVLENDAVIGEDTTLTVGEGHTLRVLGKLTNHGTLTGAGRVAVSVLEYKVSTETPYEGVSYDITATKNGTLDGTKPVCTMAYEISLDGGASWIEDTTGGNAQAVLVKSDGTATVYASFRSAYTNAKTGEAVHMLTDAHVQSSNAKKNYGPLFSYYGLILEGNGHTIYTDLEASGASNEYATLKFSSYLAGTGPAVNPVLKNVTIDSQNNAKADLDFVSGDVTFTVTMYNVKLQGNCQYAKFEMKSPSMIVNKSNVAIYDCQIPSWDLNSAKAIDIYSGAYSLSLNSKCTAYGGTYTKDVTEYLAEGKTVKQIDGKYVVENDPAYGMTAKIGSNYYKTLADAIAAVGDGNVVIELLGDAVLDYNAREAYGTADTTGLTINGNGHILTLNQKDSDWSSFGLYNEDAKLVLNKMTIEKTGYGDTSGAWNTHAINFTCEVEMNDVTVNNSMSVEDGATLNNVIINEANGYYALWIDGNGQTVSVNGGEINATNDGRGIKIGDENVDEPACVTLTVNGTKFNTAKKAAVLVSSTAGADVTAYNEDIANVAEDTVNFGWVDEDWAEYFGKVTPTDCTVVLEGAASFKATVSTGGVLQAYYKSVEGALAAAKNGDTVSLLADWDAGSAVVFAPGRTLDLNGFTLTAEGIATFNGSHVIDSSEDTTGLLIVPKDCLSLRADNKELPLWNEKDGYVFVTPNTSAALNYQYFEAVTDNGFTLEFRPGFGFVNGGSVKDTYLATNGGADNGLTMVLRLSWVNSKGKPVSQDVTFEDQDFITAYKADDGILFVNVVGAGAMDKITINAVIISNTGVEFVGEDIVYSPSMVENV